MFAAFFSGLHYGYMPIGVLKDGQLYFVSSGQLGEPRQITDQSGQLVWSWQHDAFGKGEPDQQPAGASKDFVYNNRFPGQTYDAETGFFYNLNRYYDPNTGRYTRPDPIGLAGGMNPYVYVGGDPVNSIDPEGLAWRQERPLDIHGLRDTKVGYFHHDRFLYDNGKDSGYYNDSMVREDDAPQNLQNKYQNVGKYLQDNILRQAEANLRSSWHLDQRYGEFTHNCQDYADAVMREYNRLLDELKNQKEIGCGPFGVYSNMLNFNISIF